MNVVHNLGEKYNVLIKRLSDYCKGNSIAFLSLVIYKAFYDVMYCIRIADVRTGYFYQVNLINIITGWMAVIVMGVAICSLYEQETSSSIILTVLTAIYFIPLLVICGFGGGPSSFQLFGLIYWCILVYLQIRIPVYVTDISEDLSNKSDIIWALLLLFVSAITIYCWAKYSHFHLQTDLYNVYELRAEAAQYKAPLIIRYLRQGAVIITSVLLIRAMSNRQWLLVIFLLLLIWISFSYAADKSVALFPVLLIGGYLFYRKGMISMIIPGFIALQVLSFVMDVLGIKWLMSFVFTRQGVALPTLSLYTYKFFMTHPDDLFRQGVMGKMGFHSIYRFLPNTIGNNYVEQAINCNNGMLSDVWSSFGYVGLIVMPIILIVCFRALDVATYKLNSRLTIGLLLFFSISFANAQWSTVLLTQGYLIVIIVLFLFPRQGNKEV